MAWLFWEELHSKLVDDGAFSASQYDQCMVNKVVDDKQLAVAWHMDDLMVSHIDEKAVEQFVESMENEFGKETPLQYARAMSITIWG